MNDGQPFEEYVDGIVADTLAYLNSGAEDGEAVGVGKKSEGQNQPR